MEISEHDDPVISENVRNEVVFCESGEGSVVCPESEDGNPCKKEDIVEYDWSTV